MTALTEGFHCPATGASMSEKYPSEKMLMDLGGAFNDLHDLGVAIEARNRRRPVTSSSSPDLHRIRSRSDCGSGGKILGHHGLFKRFGEIFICRPAGAGAGKRKLPASRSVPIVAAIK